MILPLVFLICLTFRCKKAEEVTEEPAVDIAAETEAVREAFYAQAKAGSTKDVELLMAYCADDVVFAGVPHMDKSASREWYIEWFSKGRYWDNTTIDKIEVSASGDMAYVVFSWDYFMDEESDASTGKGANVMVWKKQADGTWKIAAL